MIDEERVRDGLRFAKRYLAQDSLTKSDRDYAQGVADAFTGLLECASPLSPRLYLVTTEVEDGD